SVRGSRFWRRVASARARNRESSIWIDIYTMILIFSSTLTKSAPVTSLQRMSPSTGNALDRSRAVRRVLAGLLVANILVLIAKATIGVVAGSLAVIGDAIHSSVDAVYNVLGLVVVRVASRAPDEE